MATFKDHRVLKVPKVHKERRVTPGRKAPRAHRVIPVLRVRLALLERRVLRG